MRRLLTSLVIAGLLANLTPVARAGDTPAEKAAKAAAKEKAKQDERALKEAAKREKELAEKRKKLKPEDDPDQIGNREVDDGLNFYSIEKEIALGKGVAQEVEQAAVIVDDPIVAEYVNRIGQNLVRNSDAKVPFIIKVVEDDSVNAFALPGGFFFVHTGLILKAQTEAELAGVMAHEIAHVAARHGTRGETRGQVAQLATMPLIFMGGGIIPYLIRQGAQIALPVGMVQFSKSFEREADNLGLQYMYKSGYDPVAFVDFFEKIQAMEKTKPGSISQIFASHPMTEDRIADAQKRIEETLTPRPEYLVTTSEFQKVKARLAMLQNRRTVDKPVDDGRPTLVRKPGSVSDDAAADDHVDERPKLERR